MKKKTKIILIAVILIALIASLTACYVKHRNEVSPEVDDPSGDEFPITDDDGKDNSGEDGKQDAPGTGTQDMTDPQSLSGTPRADEGQGTQVQDPQGPTGEEEQDPSGGQDEETTDSDDPVELEEIADW